MTLRTPGTHSNHGRTPHAPATSDGSTPKNTRTPYAKDTTRCLARDPADHSSSHAEEEDNASPHPKEDTTWMSTLSSLPILPVEDQNFLKPRKQSYKLTTPASTVSKEDIAPKIVARNKRTAPRAAEVPLIVTTRPATEKSL